MGIAVTLTEAELLLLHELTHRETTTRARLLEAMRPAPDRFSIDDRADEAVRISDAMCLWMKLDAVLDRHERGEE
jgi:hypothetical protein